MDADADTYFTYFPYGIPPYEQELINNKDLDLDLDLDGMGVSKAQDNNANNNAKDAKVESGGGGTNKPASAGWNRLKNSAKSATSTASDDSNKDKKPLIQPPSGDDNKTAKPKSAGWNKLKGATTTTKQGDAKTEETKLLKDETPAPAQTTTVSALSGVNAKARWGKSKELLGINANGNVKPILTRTDSLVVPGQTQRPSISFSEGRDSLHSQSEKSLGSRRGSRFSAESRFSAIDLSKITAAQGAQEEEEEEEQTKGLSITGLNPE